MVCFQCGENINRFFQILFKTADEIKNFAERMKKIGEGMSDQNARYSFKENDKSSKEFGLSLSKLGLLDTAKKTRDI